MTIEELTKLLQEQEGNDILLELQGIVTTTIHIAQMKISHEKNFLFLENKENNKQRVGFNLNQLMRIHKIEKNKILLEFDQLQNAMITIKKAITSFDFTYIRR